MSDCILSELAAVVRSRRSSGAANSYTRQLLDRGPQYCARKFGEEALEAMIAGIAEEPEALGAEAADVVYHLLVVLESRNVEISDVIDILRGRMGQSGLDEKASRASR